MLPWTIGQKAGILSVKAKFIKRRPTNTTEFIEKVIKPLAKKLQKEFPGYKARVIGPCGLDVEVLIALENGIEEDAKSLTFCPGQDFALMMKDYSVNLERFKPGTIGYLNGMNFPLVKVPKKGRVKWCAERLQAQRRGE